MIVAILAALGLVIVLPLAGLLLLGLVLREPSAQSDGPAGASGGLHSQHIWNHLRTWLGSRPRRLTFHASTADSDQPHAA